MYNTQNHIVVFNLFMTVLHYLVVCDGTILYDQLVISKFNIQKLRKTLNETFDYNILITFGHQVTEDHLCTFVYVVIYFSYLLLVLLGNTHSLLGLILSFQMLGFRVTGSFMCYEIDYCTISELSVFKSIL